MGNSEQLRSVSKGPSSKPRKGSLSRAISKRKELIGLATGAVLTATAAHAEWKNSTYSVTHGQIGGNQSPFNVYLDPGKTQAVQMFASNHGTANMDLYCAKSLDGGNTYAVETVLDDSLLTSKINTGAYEQSVAVRYNSGTSKFDLYYVSDILGANGVYESLDFDLANCKANNEPTLLPYTSGKINESGQVQFITIDPVTNDKLYYSADSGSGGKLYVSSFGTWDKTAVAGFTDTADIWGLSLYNGNMIYDAKLSATNNDIYWKPFVSGAGVGGAAKIEAYPGMTAVVNTSSREGHPMVDAKGILWYSNAGKIARKDPVTVIIPPDGGSDAPPDSGAGGETGSAGSDSGTAGTDSGTAGGDSGTAGSDSGSGGTGGETGGSGGSGGADSGAAGAETGGSGGETGGAAGETGADSGAAGAETGGSGGETGTDAGPEGGEGGETGIDAAPDGVITPGCDDTFIFTAGEGALTITDCDDKHITGVYDGKHEVDIKSPDGKLLALHKAAGGNPQTITWTLPNFVKVPVEVDYGFEENPGDSDKWVFSEQGGTPLGAEASKGEHFNPEAANLNPELAQGRVRVRAYQMVEGSERMFNDNCVVNPGDKIFDRCQPQTFSIDGNAPGRIPQGQTFYLEIATGKGTTNPDELAVTVDPVTKEAEPNCNCETVQSHTSGNIYALLGGAFVGIALARRRKKGKTG